MAIHCIRMNPGSLTVIDDWTFVLIGHGVSYYENLQTPFAGYCCSQERRNWDFDFDVDPYNLGV
jgi:hypothetical protein